MIWELVADVGGTNMRLAAAVDGRIKEQHTFDTTGNMHLTDAIRSFVDKIGSSPRHVVVAAAGVIQNGYVTLTNAGNQQFSQADLVVAAGAEGAKILNDFEAAAWSLVTADPDDLTLIQGKLPPALQTPPEPTPPRLIIGPGTGLGVGTQVWAGHQPEVLQGEGGHVRVAPHSLEEVEVFAKLSQLWPETQMDNSPCLALEAEAILSGTGIPYLMKALELLNGQEPSEMSARDIFDVARTEGNPLAVRAIDMFSHHLGAVAGDLALYISAYGGVFLTGGVLQKNEWIFQTPHFLRGFNQGGRHTKFRVNMPIYLYRNSNFGLEGAINAMRFDPDMQ
ncbi:ROK family protein [uncultured Cohaesibacter sp.]|uniref:glucokinase n=1 Tax=uncultured Cohaesibacter sp. TaxID=1002546 RepID=UPI0029C79D73|nr:ROK family protein [uncultured Cohaesibacter sp.]